MTAGNKIMWKRGEIAPKELFLLFSTLFIYIYIYIFLTSGVKIHIHLLNVVVQFIVFLTLSTLICRYVEVRISRSVSVSPLEFEITRVDCITILRSLIFGYKIIFSSLLSRPPPKISNVRKQMQTLNVYHSLG